MACVGTSVGSLVKAGQASARQSVVEDEARDLGRGQRARGLVNCFMEDGFDLELSVFTLCWAMETDESYGD